MKKKIKAKVLSKIDRETRTISIKNGERERKIEKGVTVSIVDQRALRGGNAASLYSRVSTTITNREYDMLMMVCNNCRLAAAVRRGAAAARNTPKRHSSCGGGATNHRLKSCFFVAPLLLLVQNDIYECCIRRA